MSTCTQAIKAWEAKHEKRVEESAEIKLCGVVLELSPIVKMDKSLNSLKKCEHLSLSTNAIDRMAGLAGMSSLRVLSIGRNNLKKIEKIEEVASTLEQLWVSYNQISFLDGLACLSNLTTLYCSNNNIKNFSELDKLASLDKLKDVLFVGNPMYDDVAGKKEARIEILKHLPKLTKIDGEMVKPSEVEEALKGGDI
mmetsp:Transcript_38820/g.57027  ORF Transcript_38820/g.57027 Transcript_38820/m.57027 type:complete len:196 (+) Transcript_38820:269-856(+)